MENERLDESGKKAVRFTRMFHADVSTFKEKLKKINTHFQDCGQIKFAVSSLIGDADRLIAAMKKIGEAATQMAVVLKVWKEFFEKITPQVKSREALCLSCVSIPYPHITLMDDAGPVDVDVAHYQKELETLHVKIAPLEEGFGRYKTIVVLPVVNSKEEPVYMNGREIVTLKRTQKRPETWSQLHVSLLDCPDDIWATKCAEQTGRVLGKAGKRNSMHRVEGDVIIQES